MSNPMEGYANLGNLANLNSFSPDKFGKKLNIDEFENIDKLNNFLDSADDPELLKGVVTKIQQGEGLEQTDLSGLSDRDKELATDLQSLRGTAGPGEVADKFSDLLGKYVNSVDQKHKVAEKAVETFASGGNIDVHSVMIASEQAKLSMQLTMQLRNKIVQAYQELQRVRV